MAAPGDAAADEAVACSFCMVNRKILGRVAFMVVAGIGLYVVWPSLMTVFS